MTQDKGKRKTGQGYNSAIVLNPG